MRLELVTIGIALPVEVNLDLSLEDSGDELLVLLDEGIELLDLFSPLFLASLSHKDFQDLFEPFLNLTALQIFAKSLQTRRKNPSQSISLLIGLNLFQDWHWEL